MSGFTPVGYGSGSGGITSLSGDVTATGPGAAVATVVAINGSSVPAGGSLTTGNVLQVSGAMALSYGPVNLALAAAVTGLLAVTNIAPSSTTGQVLTTTSGGATVAWATPAASGINQLTGDVTAGPGTGSQVATVARVNGATVPAAGALTTGNVPQVTGPSALGYAPINLAGGANYITGNLPVTNIAPSATTGQVLATTSGGATVAWSTPAAAGITQLTGDVTAGPGSGSQAATVAKVNGATVPAGGALTAGNVLQVTGPAALGYAPINLAGGANYVTGNLPVTNIAPSATTGQVLTTTSGGATVAWSTPAAAGITQLTGDVTAGPGSGSQAATVVSAQSGALTFGASTGLITAIAADTGPGIKHVASTSLNTPASMTLTPQPASGLSGTAAQNTPGSLIVALASPGTVGTAGAAAAVTITSGPNLALSMGALTNSTTASTAIWMSPNIGSAFTPSSTNYAIAYGPNSSALVLGSTNGPAKVQISAGGSACAIFQGLSGELDLGFNLAIGSTAFTSGGSYGGGARGIINIQNASTNPSSAITGGVLLYASSAAFQVYPGGVTSPTATFGSYGATLTALTLASDVAPTNTSITAQSADPTATTNLIGASIVLAPGSGATGAAGGTSGNLLVQFSAPTSPSTTYGNVILSDGGTQYLGIGKLVTPLSATAFAAIYAKGFATGGESALIITNGVTTPSTGTPGGPLYITAQPGDGSTTSGGNIIIQAGNSAGTGVGGNLELAPGSSVGGNGQVQWTNLTTTSQSYASFVAAAPNMTLVQMYVNGVSRNVMTQ